MHIPPLDPGNSPLSDEQARHFNHLASSLSPDQSSWVSGYLAGIRAVSMGGGSAVAPRLHGPGLTVLVGSQTGNGDKVADEIRSRASARGLQVVVKSMGDYKFPQLKNEKNLLVVVSTQGEGDPPDNAKEFYRMLHSRRAPRMDGVRFSTLGLGDSSYTYFCKTGIALDKRFEEIGAERLCPRVDCDVDYEEDAAAWIDGALEAFSKQLGVSVPAPGAVSPGTGGFISEGFGAGKSHPFSAAVLDNILLSGRGSGKEVRHIELSLEGSGLVYEPGDALGVYPLNSTAVVDELIGELHLEAAAVIPVKDESLTLREAFLRRFEVTTLTRPMMQKYAALVGSKTLDTLLAEENIEGFVGYVSGRTLIDLVRDFPCKGITAAEFVQTLRRLPARLYSICSSLDAHPDEVHLTVVAVRYESRGRFQQGVCSTYLAAQQGEDDTVPVYIEHNRNFKLPADPAAPMIMIGPGTGVAPFRAFMESREISGATGRNWLFFGDQHFETDFLYQLEWQRYRQNGLLTHIDLAFSRDQPRKIYVQHRLLERQAELFAWLEEGACVYVCGDERHMAHDVHHALLDIIRRQGGRSAENAEDYLNTMQREKRYQRDVY